MAEITLSEEQQQIVNSAPEPDGPGKVTFYCAIEGKGSNQQIPIGGHREKDSSGRVLAAPFSLIKFTEGIYRTDDPDQIKILRKLAKDTATGVTEDMEHYLSQVLTPERQLKRLETQGEELRKENNRLRDQLKTTGRMDAPNKTKVTEGAVSSGSVPRRRD